MQRIFDHLDRAGLLIARLIYGCGIRVQECVSLRVHDLDFEQSTLTIRSGKGDKDRLSVLPESLKDDLYTPLDSVRGFFDRDAGNAGCEGFWLFPAGGYSIDPRSGTKKRHHLHVSILQKRFRQAVQAAGIAKQATVHSLRHSFAAHLLEKRYDIRTIQELLGHSNLQTTMIHAHVAGRNILGVTSPLDG